MRTSDYLDSGESTRIYRAAGFWKYAMTACSVLIGGGSLAGIWFGVFGGSETGQGRALVAALCAVFLAMAVYCLLWVFKAGIVLDRDCLTIRGPLRTRILLREDLSGWRVMPTAPPTLVLQPREKSERAAKVSLLFPVDDTLSEWLSKMPNLDDTEREIATKEVLEDETLGRNVSERSAVWQVGLKNVKIFNGIGAAASVWAVVCPKPYVPLLLLLCALPLVGLEMVRRSKGLFRIDEYKNDPRPSVGTTIVLVPMMLALRAMLDYNILYTATFWLWCGLFTAALMAVALLIDPSVRKKKATLGMLVPFIFAYVYGATVEINAMRDKGPVQEYTTVLHGKHIDHGKHTSYNLELGPWGPKRGENKLEVNAATYSRFEAGDTVRLGVVTGWLGVRWYFVRRSLAPF